MEPHDTNSDKLTRGEAVIRFIELACVIPEGQHVGKPVRLADFQKRFILEVYDNPHETDTAILSIARKNAKTGTIAFLVLAHTVGPEAVRNSRIVSGAMSREQAAEVYNLASKCVQLSPKLSEIVRIIPSSKKLIGLPMNVEYQAISAEGKTAHGKSPILAILDEVGQIRGPQSDFVDAITTAQGAYDNPLLIYISTQAANDGDLFSVLIDDAQRNKPEKTVCHVYAADKDAEVTDEEQWKKANPALGLFRSEKDMRKQAEKAARMPSFENTFRNLNLNQRVSTVSPFVSKSVWESCGGEVFIPEDAEVYGGLDLSSKTDLTAFVLISRVDGVLQAESYFWTPEVGLVDRSKRDRQPYDVWVRDGWLRTTPGATVDYGFVAMEIAEIIGSRDLVGLSFDRWRIDVFKAKCEELGIELPLIEFGQGYKDMAPAIDTLEAELLNGRIAHGMHPVLTMCAANAVVTKDPAGNRKLDKHKASGRIDGMAALAMAIGGMEKSTEAAEPPSPWEDENFSILG
jgi:phage terminase large subunit-like protein